MEVLLSLPQVQVFDIRSDTQGLRASGDLQFVLYLDVSMAGLIVGEYRCTLSKQLPFSKVDTCLYLMTDFDGYVGFVLSQDTEEELAAAFERLLFVHTKFDAQGISSTPKERSYSERFAGWLESSSAAIKEGLMSGSTTVGKGLKQGGAALKTRLSPCEEEKEVPDYVRKGADGLKTATGHISSFSKKVSGKAVTASETVGKAISSGAAKATRTEDPESAKPSGLRVIASSAGKALKNLWEGAERSVVILAQSTRDATVDVVHHKYGGNVSGVVSTGLGSVGDLGMAGLAIHQVLPHSLATNVVTSSVETKSALPPEAPVSEKLK